MTTSISSEFLWNHKKICGNDKVENKRKLKGNKNHVGTNGQSELLSRYSVVMKR